MTTLANSSGIRVVGFDPSMRNWGIAKGILIPDGSIVQIESLDVVKTDSEKAKQVRQNSHDLGAAETLARGAVAAAQGAQAIFVEVPVNSQSARAAMSCGLCIGVLGALRAMGIPFFEVSPNEVKMVSVGKKTATKDEMIDWAMKKHPDAPWPMQTQKGVTTVVASTAEHMADAVAAIHAGINSTSFKQSLHLMQFRQAA
jgi:Holliday junction resolvasome RuvABC endonuclease subunit